MKRPLFNQPLFSRPLFNRLSSRIFAIFWLTLMLVVVVLLLLPHLDPRSQHTIPQPELDRYQDAAARISERLSSQPGTLQEKLLPLADPERHKGMQLYFTNDDGELLTPHQRTKALRNFITSADSPDAPRQKLYGRWMVAGPFLVKDQQQSALMYIGRVSHRPPPFFLRILDQPFHLLLLTMLVSTPLLLWLAWALSRPAHKLQEAAQRVASGQFTQDPTLESSGPREFRQAGASFNQMVSSVNQMIGGQQRLLSDISHELRSPLTRLRMATALAQRKQGNSAELERIDTEAERLEAMIAKLLELSRMQIHGQETREYSDAVSLWQDMLDDAEFEASQHKKSLACSPLLPWPLAGNTELLISALENVVRNAIYYSKDRIEVQFSANDHSLTVTIDDNGEGVPDDQLKDIFRPFYRVSTARDRHSGGTGLGLAITENAIRQHNGSITASHSPLGGLRVTLMLPLAQKSQRHSLSQPEAR
ncbi:envelope stress sensor histidine kinase CpxA [Photobacterium halotolerans]|uniref:envelope stress sensor histidine kinase CpxA n=1 Tax=Photobacterium halotolerans TaxID=265726 RepID=UPI0013736365|nr:envelope stress sensor histidine kinase CpxA [Photobacterium halotolerans]NAX46476.1 envelope stress sensor histidine kinase CpxA [Photobacterium halotolerans]